ncbi:MAG: hypothetical protein JXQ87_05815 [Bacteroidia bacterium]
MKSIIFFVSVVAVLAASFILVGFVSPVEQKNEISKEFNCSKETLWSKISDLEFYKQLKEDIAQVVELDESGNNWHMFSNSGSCTKFEIIESTPGEKLVLKVTDQDLGIESLRTYQLYGNENSSVLTVKEHKKIEPILLRSTMAISGGNQFIKKEIDNLYSIISIN